MRKTLITPNQVILYSSLQDNTEASKIENHIGRFERSFKNSCLGDLYDLLLADTFDYTSAPDWAEGVTYAEDQYVLFGWEVYRSTADSNTTVPCDYGSSWEVAASFATQCFEDLWQDSLRMYLAEAVAAVAIPFISTKVGSKGAIEFVEDNTGIRSASRSVVAGIQNVYKSAADIWLTEVQKFITANQELCTPFAEAAFIKELCDVDCIKPNRLLSRFGYSKSEPFKPTVEILSGTPAATTTIKPGYQYFPSVTGTDVITLIELMDPGTYTDAEINLSLTVFRSNIKAIYPADFSIQVTPDFKIVFVDPLTAEPVEIIQRP